MKKILKSLISVLTVVFIVPLGKLVYDSKYLGGKYFSHYYSRGWLWVLKGLFQQKLLGKNRSAKWPVAPTCTIISPENIQFHRDDLNNFQGYGNYYQATGGIIIGKGTWIAPNVGLITANHDINNLEEHAQAKKIVLGEECWIGMNAVILPGVELGNKTIVGAGSVVTKSFPEGNCVIAGNPAKIIRHI